MRRTVPVVALVLALAVAGCLSLGPGSSSSEPQSDVSVEYVIDSGGAPDTLESVTVTMQVVFVENAEDFSRNSCWRDTYYGPYKPTPTPIASPDGDCRDSQAITVDLTDPNQTQTLTETVPGRFDAGHALVVSNVTGTSVSGIKGVGGQRVTAVEGRPGGQYSVEIAIESVEDRRYDYVLVSETDDTDRP